MRYDFMSSFKLTDNVTRIVIAVQLLRIVEPEISEKEALDRVISLCRRAYMAAAEAPENFGEQDDHRNS
ncbi:MAG: hypothetical protein IJU76_15275 [Desulfovibrionaceae bacterium]|nr:hypothetical protein [Desulfovibrionaceae bacterium]